MGKGWYLEIDGEWIMPPQPEPVVDPLDPNKKPKKPKLPAWLPLVLERHEVKELLAAPESGLEKLTLRVLYASGMRVEEVVGLSADSLEGGSHTLKLARGRQVVVDAETFRELSQLDWSLWKWTVPEILDLVARAAERTTAGERFRAVGRTILPKALRNAYGCHCLENGMDLYSLHQLLGNPYVDTTEAILKLAVGRWRGQYDARHPLAGQRAMGGKEQAHLSVDEVFALLAAAKLDPDPVLAARDYFIVRLLYASGMRNAELGAMIYADVFYEECRLFIRQGKGSKDRYVLIDRETARLLRERQGDQPLSAPLVEIEERQVANVVKKVGKRTGLLKKYKALGFSLSPHTFRHAFATHLYRNGMDSFAIEKLLGHSDLGTTFDDYVTCDLEHWQKAYSKNHELLRG